MSKIRVIILQSNRKALFVALILLMAFLQLPLAICETSLSYTTVESQVFTASSDAIWIEYDLFMDNGIPKGAVAEIIIRNANQASECTGGVRIKGSSIERKINLHEAEGGGFTTVNMLVKTDLNDGKIEVYAENNVDTDFVILGYFEGCDFIETFDDLGWASAEWVETDLSVYGVPSDAVVQMMCASRSQNSRYFLGVRATNSTLERTVLMDESEGVTNANNIISMIVKANANSTIERKAGVGTLRGRHHLLGWFGSNVDFIEGFTQVLFSGKRVDGVWESRTLTEPPASSIVTFAMVHQDSGSETLCGLREKDSAINRYLEEHEAEGGGETGFMVCMTLDANSSFEIYCADSSESMFFYMGYFFESYPEPEPEPSPGGNPPSDSASSITVVADMTWIVIVLWLVFLILSQLWRDPDGRKGFQAFGSVMGFVLCLELFGIGQAVMGLVLAFLSMWLLYTAIESW